ncbi:MAG: transketolase [Flavobacteriales bacterium]|nr:transketolase [Flavobacteriales bacterium]
MDLYQEIMEYDATHFSMQGDHEDLFFLSNGHISPVWYSVLARSGFFPVEELATFRKLNSRLQGHPATEEKLPGIRVASGSLGQGLSVACGAALAKKLNKDSKLVFSLHGDGELQEGQIWEAAMFASAHKIDNLIATVDYNGRQIDGDVKDVLDLGDLDKKWHAFGWKVLHMDGNNLENVINTLQEAKGYTGNHQPIVIIMKTEMGQGVDFMMGTHKWHGVAPNDDQLAKALSQLDETLGDY